MNKLVAIKTMGTSWDGKPEINISWRLEGSTLKFRSSVSLQAKDTKLADRLCRAIEAGVVVKNVREATDNNGNKYLTDDFVILMRMANAELKRLGF